MRKSQRILDQPFDLSYAYPLPDEDEFVPNAEKDDDEEDADADAVNGDGVEIEQEEKKKVTVRRTAATRDDGPADAGEKNKCKYLDARIDYFLSEDVLCVPLKPTKFDVMVIASNNPRVRFSKYSGVVEWRNCVFLWVNVPAPGVQPDYPNRFREQGRLMSWFGGSRMHADTPVVLRMQESGQNVLLFVRFEKESYTCLGRVYAEKANVDRHPVSFVWRLRDWDRLRGHKYFQNVMDIMLDKD